VLSNFRGEGKPAKKYFYPTVRFAMIMAFIMMLVVLACVPFIDFMGFEEHLIPAIKQYMIISAFATFGGYLHCMAKEYLQSFEIVLFPNILNIFCIFLNIGLNILFVFGWKFIPSMGAIGIAIASLITRLFMGIVLFAYCFKRIKIEKSSGNNKLYYKDLLKVGLPASIAIMIEFAAFNIVAVIMGRISGIYAAAHNILCTLTSVSFMIPLAVSNAMAVKVGFANGAKQYDELKKYAFTGMKVCSGFMACSAIFIGCFPEFLIKLFTVDAELIKVCVPIVYVLCAFQIFDGWQVSLSGIFRGIKKTKIVMISNFITYWFMAFPLGCFLALKVGLNLMGFWISIGLSAIVLCTTMFVIMQNKFRKMES
jgi:MATE family multidrug resistance protein